MYLASFICPEMSSGRTVLVADYHIAQIAVWRWVNHVYGQNKYPWIVTHVAGIDEEHEEEVMELFEKHGWPILTEELYDETFPN